MFTYRVCKAFRVYQIGKEAIVYLDYGGRSGHPHSHSDAPNGGFAIL